MSKRKLHSILLIAVILMMAITASVDAKRRIRKPNIRIRNNHSSSSPKSSNGNNNQHHNSATHGGTHNNAGSDNNHHGVNPNHHSSMHHDQPVHPSKTPDNNHSQNPSHHHETASSTDHHRQEQTNYPQQTPHKNPTDQQHELTPLSQQQLQSNTNHHIGTNNQQATHPTYQHQQPMHQYPYQSPPPSHVTLPSGGHYVATGTALPANVIYVQQVPPSYDSSYYDGRALGRRIYESYRRKQQEARLKNQQQHQSTTPAPTSTPNAAPNGIICLPVKVPQPDPQNPTKTIEIDQVVCYPAPASSPVPAAIPENTQQPFIPTGTAVPLAPLNAPGLQALYPN